MWPFKKKKLVIPEVKPEKEWPKISCIVTKVLNDLDKIDVNKDEKSIKKNWRFK